MLTGMSGSYGQQPTYTVIPLEKCRPDHWDSFPQIKKDYQSLGMPYWKCPSKNSTVSLQGSLTTAVLDSFIITVTPCQNHSINDICASKQQIDAYF